MDHVWNSLRHWADNWEERIEDEKKRPDYKGKEEYIKQLKGELKSIRKAMDEIHKWF
ncbi:hypothetical protein [Bacillus kwashiorkori]|uniref:hypothetical protein n=1 Tax=Bacillus kwashiorkori TaxID=1522318 RepID=UPI001319B97F|nr:hypothetical protein [Bacillus kwashiorkori]